MPTVKQIIERLQTMQPDEHIAAHIWSTEDVLGKAREMGFCLTQEQANDAIDRIDSHTDSELGITWMTLKCTIDDIAGKKPCTHCEEDHPDSRSDCAWSAGKGKVNYAA